MVREVFLEYRVLFFLNFEPGGTLEHHEILDCLGVQGASAIVTDISGRVEKPLYTCTRCRNRKDIPCKSRQRGEVVLMILPEDPRRGANNA
jgi:hypothetical protein